ncbi:MAG: metallophosphoesterase [Verrucomicrobiales bacterium]|jgi:3',5'-cyclic AMP phosphodiesterase CpdA|nr:metallophosphoesterase [Verrucomicrobiales bacterium]
MKTIAHLSDLHFGTEDPELALALLHDLRELDPSLVVVSGDLTQRARTREFEAAAAWLGQIQSPKLVIPGNHDIPLFDIIRRFAMPLNRFGTHISEDLNPFYEDQEMALLGINTARSLTWKSGRISQAQILDIRSRMGAVAGGKFKILVTHHPFIPPPGEPEMGIDLVKGASKVLLVLDECQVDLLLAGHLHQGYTGDVRSYYPGTKRSMLVVQAGTAISRRIRSEPNAYNLITLDEDRISILVRVWNGYDFTNANVAVSHHLRFPCLRACLDLPKTERTPSS